MLGVKQDRDMPSSIHFICRHEGGRYKNLDRVEGQTYRSHAWAVPASVAASLVGGWIYLHETKAEGSGFGGVIKRVEPVGVENGLERYAVFFEGRREGRGQPWRGSSYSMAWTSGPVDLSFSHESVGA